MHKRIRAGISYTLAIVGAAPLTRPFRPTVHAAPSSERSREGCTALMAGARAAGGHNPPMPWTAGGILSSVLCWRGAGTAADWPYVMQPEETIWRQNARLPKSASHARDYLPRVLRALPESKARLGLGDQGRWYSKHFQECLGSATINVGALRAPG